MLQKIESITISLTIVILSFPASAAVKEKRQVAQDKGEITAGPSVLWKNPTDISSRNLLYGAGGREDQPPATFIFEKEDLDGTNPKYVVHDKDGVKWKIKLGQEARPETVAARLTWAAGYYTNEDYFLPVLHVEGLPPHLHRGQHLVGSDGSMHNARLKRYLKNEKKIGTWQWRDDPFSGTRELNGLRIVMALMNNWDLKDENNAVYKEGPERIYMVSDLGASFGSTGLSWTQKLSKGNLRMYSHSRFIRKVTTEYVDFNMPTRPALIRIVGLPEYLRRIHLRWIGEHIPRDDAKWMGQLLARLSPRQISDAFRAAGYSPEEVDGFSRVVESRIAELNRL
jgi:hypothetical protein